MKQEIKIPTHCPSCESELEIVNSQLFCRNKLCPAQSSKKVEAFVKKMRIKGFGPSTISKLGFTRPIELYETSLDDYVAVMGEKMGNKLYDEVQNSKRTTFATFLSALSIPLIGDTASRKIAQFHNTIDDLVHDIHLEMIGEKARQSIQDYFDNNYFDVIDLELWFEFFESEKPVEQNKGKVCITGKLKDFSNRTKAKEFLESLGYTVTSTVSSVTDYLVCEDGSNSSKSKKAESLGIPIVSIAELKGN
jgi:DNA ligase (NAD+)